jgi:hypothetical protein
LVLAALVLLEITLPPKVLILFWLRLHRLAAGLAVFKMLLTDEVVLVDLAAVVDTTIHQQVEYQRQIKVMPAVLEVNLQPMPIILPVAAAAQVV